MAVHPPLDRLDKLRELTLYLHPLTVNSIKINLLCNALEISPRIQPVELFTGEHKSAAFLALNPDGKVPVLTEGDWVLSESNAIMQYLANEYDSPLWPASPKLQAQVLKWLLWQPSHWAPVVSPFAQRKVVMAHYGFERPLTAEHHQAFHQLMLEMEHRLAGSPYLVGDQHSLADIALGAFMIFADKAGIPLAEYPNVSRWLDSLQSTSWWQQSRHWLDGILSSNS